MLLGGPCDGVCGMQNSGEASRRLGIWRDGVGESCMGRRSWTLGRSKQASARGVADM